MAGMDRQQRQDGRAADLTNRIQRYRALTGRSLAPGLERALDRYLSEHSDRDLLRRRG